VAALRERDMSATLEDFAARGWVMTRDGSTSTAYLAWSDPDDPESGWEVLVLHTAGHGARFTLNVLGSGLTERSLSDLRALQHALEQASELLAGWGGEIPDEE
jgi:hypothetical protein